MSVRRTAGRPGQSAHASTAGFGGAALAAVAAAVALIAGSQDVLAQEPGLDSGDTAWMLTSTALVLMMTVPGLAMFYCGMVRRKNVLSAIMQVFATCCLATLIWTVAGYSLAFSGEGAFVGGLGRFFLAGMTLDSASGTIPESVFMTFQMTFAIITPALITGAFADRMKFSALLWFIGLWSVCVYPVIAHWVWGAGGWVGGLGALDFAGGTVVHINCGIAGLVAAIVIGKRLGYGSEIMAPDNLVYSVIGASLLWVGWFGFNAGSAGAANGRAGMAMAVTQIATAAAALAWMFVEWIKAGKPSVLGIVSGAVAGLVAITPAAGFVGPGGALVIGIAAGIVCYFASTSMKHALGYDDSLDVFGIHGVGGIVGAILTGVFAVEAIGGTAGVLEGNPAQLVPQIYGVVATLVWSGVVSLIILKVIDATIGLRVSAEVERDSLDLQLHGETVQ
ncbi:MAG TPA: ammonium transporter [Geminicoccaceae bacterium]|nr:ammonium transporter [Geminicoccaceae bacterium]